jgi:hypothetical protein
MDAFSESVANDSAECGAGDSECERRLIIDGEAGVGGATRSGFNGCCDYGSGDCHSGIDSIEFKLLAAGFSDSHAGVRDQQEFGLEAEHGAGL